MHLVVLGRYDRLSKSIFDEFYKLGSHDAQNQYLFGLIERHDVKCRRAKRTSSTKTNVTYTYHVRYSDGNTHVVWKKAFCGIHAIGKRHMERLCEKLSAGELISSDARGTHKNRPHGIPEEVNNKFESIFSRFSKIATLFFLPL